MGNSCEMEQIGERVGFAFVEEQEDAHLTKK